ncbi:MAG TPA: hypothetical protein VN673_16440 [Clostridia bacterium]|nr:hypothetical protein [Clostridia bacterium]
MELYYKDLISEEASLEKLVDDLMRVVQGVDELASAIGTSIGEDRKQEIATRLTSLKEGCRKVKAQAVASALAVDKVLHQYPYSTAGFAFAFGVVAGTLLRRSREG